jgi:hypothetical protein
MATPTIPPPTGPQGTMPQTVIPPEVMPNLDELIIEDGQPVDSIYMEKQERLLTEPLYSGWTGPGPGHNFQVFANVGLFFAWKEDPLVPDVMLAIDIRLGHDFTKRENLSYFMWDRGKPPDVVVEMVSNRRGREEDFKLDRYARIGVPYYIIYDPEGRLKHGVLRSYRNDAGTYQPLSELRFPRVGLGLQLWQGTFENREDRWLRWCDLEGNLISTGNERAEQERQRAEQERQQLEKERTRIQRLEAQLRAQGIEPTS